MGTLMHSYYTCQSLVLIRVLELQLQAVTQLKDVAFTWLGRKKEDRSYHLSHNKNFMCFSAKKTHLTVHTEAARSTLFSLVQAFTLREGRCVFGFVKYFNTKVDSGPSPQYFSAGFPSSKVPVIYVDLWDLWPHRWTGYWSAALAPAWAACDSPPWWNRTKPAGVLVFVLREIQ